MALESTNAPLQTTSSPAGVAQVTVAENEPLRPNDLTPPLWSLQTIQPKLTVGSPDDPYEKEADAVAEQVMRMPEPSFLQRKCAHCESEEKINRKILCDPITPFIQTKSEGNTSVTNAIARGINSSRGSGSALDGPTQSFMASRFGSNFNNVKIHNNDESVKLNRSLNAKAFTVGNDIYFNQGQYQPGSSDGKKLLAHELTHVVQQSAFDEMNGSQNNEKGLLPITLSSNLAIARFPSSPSFGTYESGLSIMPPVIKEEYDGNTFTAIKNNWGLSSFERRWQIYDAEDQLLHENYYTWPQPTLYIPKDVVAKGKAEGENKPWSVWHEVTKTIVPFGGGDKENFPYTYTKFYVYETWNDFMADPNAKLSTLEKIDRTIKSTPLDSSIVTGARSVVDYGSVVAMHEAYLREIYDSSAKGITDSAKKLVNEGLPQRDAAKWANEARNVLKDKIRSDGNPILKKVFESRNLNKYGNKLGPTYEQLYQKYSKQGLSPEEINKKIIGSSGKANIKVNRWSGRLRVAGRIMLVIDVALAGVKVYLAPEGEKTQVALEEVARIGGALAFGTIGAKAGAAGGAAVGALFAGVGAAPGAVIGGVLGAIGGAIFGGWLGKSAVEKLYEMLPPSDCVFEGEFMEE